MPRAILFDLDGTLVDTRTASWELFAETNAAFGLGIDTRDAFFKAFEDNFFESLAKLPVDPARLEAAKQQFMEALRTRYSPPFIPGMADVVRALAPHCMLAVVSTNEIGAIRRILVDEGLATCFSHVFSGDVEPRKSVSIRRFLNGHGYSAGRHCTPDYSAGHASAPPMDAADVVLVTDTVGDVSEAVEVGVNVIGVSWGMHTEEQLLKAGAQRVALWPQELLAWLRSEQAATTGNCAVQRSCSCNAPSVPDMDAGVVRAGTLRRAQQLQRRQQTGVEASQPRAGGTGAGDASREELRQALARIMSGAS